MTNPLTIKKYYVFESLPWIDCIPTEKPSYISTQQTTTGTPNVVGPMNLFEISEYIQQSINTFIKDSQAAGKCELSKKEILTNSNSTIAMPPECSNFNEYSGSIVFGNSKYIPITRFPEYIKPTQQKKNLCQRMADVGNLLTSFNTILKGLDTELKKFPDQYNKIISMEDKNITLRNELDFQLQLLYSEDHNIMTDNIMKLDSTIYASVLWSILASSLVYYVFIKL